MNLSDFAVLGILDQTGPCSGYDISRELQNRCVHQWTDLKIGSLYHAIGKLQRAGFIEAIEQTQEGSRPTKTILGITQKGETYFDELQQTAFMGLYPHFYGFLLGLVLNKRKRPEELGQMAKDAIAIIDKRLDGLKDYVYECNAVNGLSEDLKKIMDDRIHLYLEHTKLLLEAEKAWLKKVGKNLSLLDNTPFIDNCKKP